MNGSGQYKFGVFCPRMTGENYYFKINLQIKCHEVTITISVNYF